MIRNDHSIMAQMMRETVGQSIILEDDYITGAGELLQDTVTPVGGFPYSLGFEDPAGSGNYVRNPGDINTYISQGVTESLPGYVYAPTLPDYKTDAQYNLIGVLPEYWRATVHLQFVLPISSVLQDSYFYMNVDALSEADAAPNCLCIRTNNSQNHLRLEFFKRIAGNETLLYDSGNRYQAGGSYQGHKIIIERTNGNVNLKVATWAVDTDYPDPLPATTDRDLILRSKCTFTKGNALVGYLKIEAL